MLFNINDTERKVLEKIKGFKGKPKSVVKPKQPKRVLSKTEKQILEILDSKGKATIKLDKVLRLIK